MNWVLETLQRYRNVRGRDYRALMVAMLWVNILSVLAILGVFSKPMWNANYEYRVSPETFAGLLVLAVAEGFMALMVGLACLALVAAAIVVVLTPVMLWPRRVKEVKE